MKLAYVCADRGISLQGTKGASAHLRNLTTALVHTGHEVTVLCARLDGPNPPPAGARILELPPAAGPDWHATTFSTAGVEAVLERYSLDGGAARPAAQRLRLPYALEVNAPLVEEAARFRGLTELETWRRREREQIAGAGRVIAVSDAVRRHAIACGATPERVTVVPNGVDLDRFAGEVANPRRELGLDGSKVVGFAGSLKPWHGVARLLEAAQQLPSDYALLVVGEGPELEALRGAAGERVIFTGAVPEAEVPRYLAAMDIAVAPYEPLEDFYFSPLKIAEYLAAGLPVVATAQGDVPELVGEAGLLVPPGDTAALAGAIRRLGDDAELRRRCGLAARRLAAGRSWEAVAERVAGVLAS